MNKQKTLNGSFSLFGKGLHTGLSLTVTFNPAPENYGYKIQRIDLPGEPIIDAVAENVTETTRGTVLTRGEARVSTVEHAMAALFAQGIDNCLIRYSKCCNPVPGDKIIGYITRGRGVSIHRQDCVNISALYTDDEEKKRLIDVLWEDTKQELFLANLKIVCNDRAGLLVDAANAMADCKVSVKAINARTVKDNMAIIEASVEIRDTVQLDNLINKLKSVKDIIDVTRNH